MNIAKIIIDFKTKEKDYNKTDHEHHDTAEILLKVVLNINKIPHNLTRNKTNLSQ
jgi:hypothetical protein